jgi:uncharacterized protein (UPF0371 family)
MHGLGETGLGATEKLHEQLQSSRVGQRWERMLRHHAHEVEAVLAVHANVREDVETALRLLSEAEQLDADTTSAVERVLDDLHRHASVPLQRDITQMRDEVAMSRGRTLRDVLQD